MTEPSTVLGVLEALRKRVPVDDVTSLVSAVSRIPYGRPPTLSAASVVESWRGTCSTKHLLLRDVLPLVDPRRSAALVHRVYTVTPEVARARWGPTVARAVPEGGLVDVHTYALLANPEVVADVTFPLADWDGVSPIDLACGDGTDYAAGDDPLATKARLVEDHCDPAVREPFIAALSGQGVAL